MDFNAEFDCNEFENRLNQLAPIKAKHCHRDLAIKELQAEKNHWEQRYHDLFEQSHTNALDIDKFIQIKEKNDTLKSELKTLNEKYEKLLNEKIDWEAEIEKLKSEAIAQQEDNFLGFQLDLNQRESEWQTEITNMKSKHATDQNNLENHYNTLLNQTNEKLKSTLATNCKLQCEIMSISASVDTPKSAPERENAELKYYKDRLVYAESKISKLENDLNQANLKNIQFSLDQIEMNADKVKGNVDKSVSIAEASSSISHLNQQPSTLVALDESLEIHLNDHCNQSYELESYDKIPKLAYTTGRAGANKNKLNHYGNSGDYKVPSRMNYSFSRKKSRPSETRRKGHKITLSEVAEVAETPSSSTKVASGTFSAAQESSSVDSTSTTGSTDGKKNTRQRKRKLLSESLLNAECNIDSD